MLGIHRATELAISLFHIGGLSGAAVHLAEGHKGEALLLAIVATACVLLLTGAVVSAEIARIKVRQYVRKHEQRTEAPEPRGQGSPDA